jgi:hypothetical protein
MRLSKDKLRLAVNPSLTLATIPPEVFEYASATAAPWNGSSTSIRSAPTNAAASPPTPTARKSPGTSSLSSARSLASASKRSRSPTLCLSNLSQSSPARPLAGWQRDGLSILARRHAGQIAPLPRPSGEGPRRTTFVALVGQGIRPYHWQWHSFRVRGNDATGYPGLRLLAQTCPGLSRFGLSGREIQASSLTLATIAPAGHVFTRRIVRSVT